MAEAALNMSLDDLIQARKKNTPAKKKPTAGAAKKKKGTVTTPGSAQKKKKQQQQLGTPKSPGSSSTTKLPALHTGTRVFVSNLKVGIDATDLQEVFSKVGMLKGIEMQNHTAIVTFKLRADAVRAIDEYNGRSLDGNVIRVKLDDEQQGGAKRKNPSTPGGGGGGDNGGGSDKKKKKSNPVVKRQKTSS